MAIFKKDTKINSCAAYDTVTRAKDSYGRINVSAKDLLVAGGHTYTVGSVVSTALASNQCPMEALERAKGFGHNLHFIYNNPICISNSETIKQTMLLVDLDATYRLEGKAFKIVPAANDNLSFEYVEEAPL
jgi:hypothetical protein